MEKIEKLISEGGCLLGTREYFY